jgi:nucleoside-diphosphate-sugar epimerase
MKLLIVGGAGYVGGVMTDLLRNYHDVTVYDSLLYEARYFKQIPFIYGDIRDRSKLAKILPDYDVVIWLAAIVGDGACAIDPFLTQSINEDSVKWLVDNYKGKIILTSTASVYGANRDEVDELSRVNPLSVYAKTKLAAETYIRQNCKNYLIFRLGTLFGLGDQHSRVRLDLVVNALTLKATLGEPLSVFGGEQWRPLLHVKDVADATNYALHSNMQGLHNLSCGNFQIKDIAETIRECIPSTTITYTDMKFEDLRNYKLKGPGFTGTGWEPMYTLELGIEEIKQVIEEHRIKNLKDPVYSNEVYLGKNYSGI